MYNSSDCPDYRPEHDVKRFKIRSRKLIVDYLALNQTTVERYHPGLTIVLSTTLKGLRSCNSIVDYSAVNRETMERNHPRPKKSGFIS
jgi:hypothetical protein